MKPCASITLAEEKLSFQAPSVCYVMLWVQSLIWLHCDIVLNLCD